MFAGMLQRDRKIPFIVITGDATMVGEFRLTPAESILVKPFPEKALITAASRAISSVAKAKVSARMKSSTPI
jgi:FixJ family two-component response regulator